MLKLQVTLRDKAEGVRTDIFEGTYPAILFREATNEFTCGDLEVAIGIQGVEVTDHPVHLEVLRLLELFQVSFGDLDLVCQRLWERQGILAFVSLAIREHRVVELDVSILQDRVRINTQVLVVTLSLILIVG